MMFALILALGFDQNTGASVRLSSPSKAGAPEATPASQNWKPVTISFYDSGYRTADGTRMNINGRWIATRLVPLGSKLEVRVGNKTITLPVKDKTSKRFGGRLDLPKGCWLEFNQPESRGLLKGYWRKAKGDKQ